MCAASAQRRTREQIIQAIDILRPIAQERDVAFLVNDNPELAAQTGAMACMWDRMTSTAPKPVKSLATTPSLV